MDILHYSSLNELTKAQQQCVVALSELFLNTESEDRNLNNAAKKLERTGLPWDQIERIFWDDTFYILIPNLIRHDGSPFPWLDHQWMFKDINQNRGAVHKRLIKAICNPLLKFWVGDLMVPCLATLKQIKCFEAGKSAWSGWLGASATAQYEQFKHGRTAAMDAQYQPPPTRVKRDQSQHNVSTSLDQVDVE
ncbi:hypothetical protein N0V87_008328 [Didymella glomerata]|uniref:DUF7079 domain-containing protein n=1 Tax=Didymella glomerata TaxID=749621 RepID=A0A9W8WTH6_9PLEO|nr:hypothetical protein N0V87_008328 [Didymella glomerata]